jgi:hypothetical protein
MRTSLVVAAGFVVLTLAGSTSATAQMVIRQPAPRPSRPNPVADFRPNASIFTGIVPTPAVRPTMGFAVGGGVAPTGFELELARSGSRLSKGAPSLNTYMVNFFGSFPVPVERLRIYAIGGIGIWNEQFEAGHGAGEFGKNLGVGALYEIAGPLKARLDYRVYFLNDSQDAHPVYPHPQRLTVGLCFGC